MPAARFAAVAAAILLIAPIAQAQTATGCTDSCATNAPSDVHAAEQVRLTAKDAIAIAERHVDGTVLEAALLLQGNNASYTVVALPKAGGVWRGSVDANSGTLTDVRTTPFHKAQPTDTVDQTTARLAQRARLPLSQAVASAESEAGGRVLNARLEDADGRATYEIQMARGDDVDDLVVDPSNGAVTRAMD